MDIRINFENFSVNTDTPILYKMMMDLDDQYLFLNKIKINNDIEFERWIVEQSRSFFHDFYIIKHEDSIIGFVYSYNFRPLDGHCKICTYIDKKYRNKGIGGVVAIRFMHLLFRDYPLRKILLEVYSYNYQSLLSNLKAGFTEEGCIKEYRYYNGEYHSLHILSIDRRTFYQKLVHFGGIDCGSL